VHGVGENRQLITHHNLSISCADTALTTIEYSINYSRDQVSGFSGGHVCDALVYPEWKERSDELCDGGEQPHFSG